MIDLHAIVRPRIGKYAGLHGLVEGFTRKGRAVVTIPIQCDERNMRLAKVRMSLDDLFLDESGATLARWAEEDRLDRSPAAPRKKLDKPLVNSIDPWDGLENQELPKDPLLRKRMQERIRTRRRLQKMTNKQREEYYAKRKIIRDRSRIKKQPQEVQA